MAFSASPMIIDPTYADDGLVSQHVTDFLQDKKFIDSYNLAKTGGALINHPGDIHFRAYIACWAAKYASNLDGDYVECGVGKALLSRTIVNYLDFENLKKKFYLFDTFDGIPIKQSKNALESANMSYLNRTHFSSNYFEEINDTFKKYSNVFVVKGQIPESFLNIEFGKVAYISIDMNNAFAEIEAIKYLWSKLIVGGVVVLDDYAYGKEFMAQKNAWDDYAIEKNSTY